MSHFASVFDMVRKESFCMGKEVSATWECFDLLVLAGTEGMPFDEFMSVSSDEWRREGPTPGMRAYYDWLRGHPAKNFKLISDAGDHPAYEDTEARWWPIRGSVWDRDGRDGDINGWVGYLSFNPATPAAAFLSGHRWRGHMERSHMEELFAWIYRVPGRRGEIQRLIANFPNPKIGPGIVNPPVTLTDAEFAALLAYNCTNPTGTRIGKAWKRRVPEFGEPHVWWRCEYIPDPLGDPKMVGIYQQEIVSKHAE